MTQAAIEIRERQRAWALRQRVACDRSGYAVKLDDNLFEPLQPDARSEYESGAGNELDRKMRALHSSSALVCNFFHYWRYRDIGIAAKACGLAAGYSAIAFERTYPKPPGIPGLRPHIDIEFVGAVSKPVAIESKFSEQFIRGRKTLKSAYAERQGVWGHLSECKCLARQLVDGGEVFEYLDAPQLLKHILGLKTEYGEGNFKLVYLWYRLDGAEETGHQKELHRFEALVSPEVDFRAVTYQQVFRELQPRDSAHASYIQYMAERYFASP